MFAKLFGPPNDQVAIKLDVDSDGQAEVRCYFKPKGLGVCSAAHGFGAGQSASKNASDIFDGLTEHGARSFISNALAMAEGLAGDPGQDEPFAKLYGSDSDQILVKLDVDGEDNSEVRFFVKPEDQPVCSFAVTFGNTPSGWEKANAAFENVTAESARAYVTSAVSMMGVTSSHGM
jgi:hypothetical protein